MTSTTAGRLALVWTLQHHWYNGGLRRWVVVAGVAISALACGVAGWSLRGALREESRVQQQLTPLAGAAPPAAAAAATGPRDFAVTLGAARPASHIVNIIQSAAVRNGVTLAAVQFQEQAAAPDRLGRTELPMTLQGPYAAIKACLAEVLGRLSTATVARLQWRRADGAADAEARVQLVVWSAPVLLAAPAATRP